MSSGAPAYLLFLWDKALLCNWPPSCDYLLLPTLMHKESVPRLLVLEGANYADAQEIHSTTRRFIDNAVVSFSVLKTSIPVFFALHVITTYVCNTINWAPMSLIDVWVYICIKKVPVSTPLRLDLIMSIESGQHSNKDGKQCCKMKRKKLDQSVRLTEWMSTA